MPPTPMVPWPGGPGPRPSPRSERLLTPGEVAALFGVDPATVARWDKEKKLTAVRTPGGHRRFRESEVRALLKEGKD
jgi:excisionase family DNA binding protein